MPLIDVTPPIGIGLPVAFCPVFSPQSGLANAGAAPSVNASAKPAAKSMKVRFIHSSLIFVAPEAALTACLLLFCMRLYVRNITRSINERAAAVIKQRQWATAPRQKPLPMLNFIIQTRRKPMHKVGLGVAVLAASLVAAPA